MIIFIYIPIVFFNSVYRGKVLYNIIKSSQQTHSQYSKHTFDGSSEFVTEIESAGVSTLSNVLVIKYVNRQNLLAEQH